MRTHKITYLDTTNFNGLSYADYLYFCEVNNIEPDSEGSDAFYTWASEETADQVGDFFVNLEYNKTVNCQPVIISGTLGLWWGSPSIEPVEVDSLAEAIKKCQGRDGQDIAVTLERGVVSVDVTHHDGINHFEIKPARGKFPRWLF